MIKNKGFTLIEVLISLAIFTYAFSALIILFFQFSKSTIKTSKCSAFSFVLIQKLLTEAGGIQVASTSEVVLDNQVLHSEQNGLYLLNQSEGTDFQIDSCDVLFSTVSTSTNPLLNNSKCLKLEYKQGGGETMCALK